MFHESDEHMCSALVHMCSEVRFHWHRLWRSPTNVLANATSFRQPCALKDIELPDGNTLYCHESCSIPRQVLLSIFITFLPNSFLKRPRTRDTFLRQKVLPGDVRALQTTLCSTPPSRAHVGHAPFVWVSVLVTSYFARVLKLFFMQPENRIRVQSSVQPQEFAASKHCRSPSRLLLLERMRPSSTPR